VLLLEIGHDQCSVEMIAPMATESRRYECPTCRSSTPHVYKVAFFPPLGRRVAAWTCMSCNQVNPNEINRRAADD
jgi:hypothetical protein